MPIDNKKEMPDYIFRKTVRAVKARIEKLENREYLIYPEKGEPFKSQIMFCRNISETYGMYVIDRDGITFFQSLQSFYPYKKIDSEIKDDYLNHYELTFRCKAVRIDSIVNNNVIGETINRQKTIHSNEYQYPINVPAHIIEIYNPKLLGFLVYIDNSDIIIESILDFKKYYSKIE